MWHSTYTISYLVAPPISLPYLPLPITLPYLFARAAPRDLYAAIATTRPPSNPLPYMNYSHSHVFTKPCAATLSLPKIIDSSLSLCISPALSDRKTRITFSFVKTENNKINGMLAIIDFRSLTWSRFRHACHAQSRQAADKQFISLSSFGQSDKNRNRFEYLIVLTGDQKTRSHTGNR